MRRDGTSRPGSKQLLATRRDVLALAALGMAGAAGGRAEAAGPAGQLVYGVHISLAPTWFDPAETSGIITPYMLLYALHDAMVKPMPGQLLAPGLAQSWSASEDGLSYDFVLRKDARFHNGEAVTAEDVKFSFERYRGAAHALLKERVAGVETSDPQHIRFRLREPWPDFLTFYAEASGAGWIVPKKYLEKVGDDGFKKAPIGAGPYRFVSFTPGVELVLEAFDRYWRKAPSVKRLVMRVIPDESTRLAALKRGEVDIAYSVRAELAEELQRTPGLTLKPTVIQSPFWLYFADQWDPKSPWHDQRVRQAASLAIDRKTINQALTLGYSPITGSVIPESFEYYWKPPEPVFDPEKARQLWPRRGFPAASTPASTPATSRTEISPRRCWTIWERWVSAPNSGHWNGRRSTRAMVTRPSRTSCKDRAVPLETPQRGCRNSPSKAALTPMAAIPTSMRSTRAQAAEGDPSKRAAILIKMQQIVYERAIFAPIWQLAFINGVGPRVGESSFGRIAGFPYTAPYEDITLKNS